MSKLHNETAPHIPTAMDENWYVVEWNVNAGKASIKPFHVQSVRKMLGGNLRQALNRNSHLAWIPVGLFRTMEEALQFSVEVHRIWLSRHQQEETTSAQK